MTKVLWFMRFLAAIVTLFETGRSAKTRREEHVDAEKSLDKKICMVSAGLEWSVIILLTGTKLLY